MMLPRQNMDEPLCTNLLDIYHLMPSMALEKRQHLTQMHNDFEGMPLQK